MSMQPPIIGITCGTSIHDGERERFQDRLNCAYSRAVAIAGGVPVILPNLEGPSYVDAVLDRLDGLLLSGGADVDPAHFGETVLNETVEVDPLRDAAELPIIERAVSRDMPILAICRGIQSLNIALGGSIYQDIPTQIPSDVVHRQTAARHEASHEVEAVGGSLFERIAGRGPIRVNSFHHQAIKEVAPSLTVSARAPDGVVEALENREARFLLAVQFHPEELVGWSEPSRALFRALVHASAR